MYERVISLLICSCPEVARVEYLQSVNVERWFTCVLQTHMRKNHPLSVYIAISHVPSVNIFAVYPGVTPWETWPNNKIFFPPFFF